MQIVRNKFVSLIISLFYSVSGCSTLPRWDTAAPHLPLVTSGPLLDQRVSGSLTAEVLWVFHMVEQTNTQTTTLICSSNLKYTFSALTYILAFTHLAWLFCQNLKDKQRVFFGRWYHFPFILVCANANHTIWSFVIMTMIWNSGYLIFKKHPHAFYPGAKSKTIIYSD